MVREDVIQSLIRFSDTLSLFTEFVVDIENNKLGLEIYYKKLNKDIFLSKLDYSSKVLVLRDELKDLLMSVIENKDNISDNYFEFINKEVGYEKPDFHGVLTPYFKNQIDIEINNSKQNKESLSNEDFTAQKNLGSFVSVIDSYFDKFSKKISSLKIFNNISRIKGNTVLIGANGSGKSTFARQLKRLHNDNLTIISAQHLLYYNKSSSLNVVDDPFRDVRIFQKQDKLPNGMNQDVNSFRRNVTEDFDRLVSSLVIDYTMKATTYYKTDDKEKSILVRAIEMWNTIIEHRKLEIEGVWILVEDLSNGEKYDFNRMSDGEKAIFYYIAHVLIANPSNYIVLDEPENHINLALCNLLWDKLEKEREDCTFVYLTHNVDFAVSRINADILWNKSFTVPDSWEIQEIPENTGIPDELLIEIAGSRKSVLFCEGDKSSIDYKLYSIIFEDQFTILPVKGHLDVINYCGAYNNAELFHGEAYGIVDGDFHSQAQIESWKQKGINTLPYSEVENLLCTNLILESLEKKAMITNEQIIKFKDAVFMDMSENIEEMVTLYIRDAINNSIKNNLLKAKKDIETLKDEIQTISNHINIDERYVSAKEEYEKIIENKDYEQYLKKSNIKGKLLKHFARQTFGFFDFEDKVLLQLRSDSNLRTEFKDQYFNDIISG